MGRNKIVIEYCEDPKQRRIHFNKRKNGFLKKASELSTLCDIKMAVYFQDLDGHLVTFFSHDQELVKREFEKRMSYSDKKYEFTTADIIQQKSQEQKVKAIKCDDDCLSCKDKKDKCTSCNEGFNFKEDENKCEEIEVKISCKVGEFEYEDKCEKCDENCLTCEGEAFKCTSCPEDYEFQVDKEEEKEKKDKKDKKEKKDKEDDKFLDMKEEEEKEEKEDSEEEEEEKPRGKCVFKPEDPNKQCLDGTFWNEKRDECSFCKYNCKTCEKQYNHCLTCYPGFQLVRTSDGYYQCLDWEEALEYTTQIEGEQDEDLYLFGEYKDMITDPNHVETSQQKQESKPRDDHTGPNEPKNVLGGRMGEDVKDEQENKLHCVKGFYWKHSDNPNEEDKCHECSDKCETCQHHSVNCNSCKYGFDRVFNKDTGDYDCVKNQKITYSAIAATGGLVGLIAGVYLYSKKKEGKNEKRRRLLSSESEIKANTLVSYQL